MLLVPVILFVVSIVTFALGRYAPSDYVEIQAGPRARPETIERIRKERGLNDPVYEQYIRYVGKALQGDFGQSVKYRGTDVQDVIFPRLWVASQDWLATCARRCSTSWTRTSCGRRAQRV